VYDRVADPTEASVREACEAVTGKLSRGGIFGLGFLIF